jgi:putative transposase
MCFRTRMRLQNFDYSAPGYYFVTICQKDRLRLFARVLQCMESRKLVMRLTSAGSMLQDWLESLTCRFPSIFVDTAVVMPDHIHLLFRLDEVRISPGTSIPEIVHWYKTMTTRAYIQGVREQNWPSFRSKLWQRSYYETVITDERRLENARRYSAENPQRWILKYGP